MKSKEAIIKNTVIASLAALAAVSVLFLVKMWTAGGFSSAESFRSYIASYGALAPIVLALIQLLLTLLPVCPSLTGCIVGGAMFGAAASFWANYIGICAGSLAAYALARRFGVRLVDKMLSMQKYEAYVEKINRSKSYPKLLFVAILLPMAPDNFLCYFSGLLNMPTKQFALIILTAKPWCILLYSVFFEHFI